jgi:hypothetical protein
VHPRSSSEVTRRDGDVGGAQLIIEIQRRGESIHGITIAVTIIRATVKY